MTYIYPLTENSKYPSDFDFYHPASQPVPNRVSYWAEKARGIYHPTDQIVYQEIAAPSDFPAAETNKVYTEQPLINSPIEDFSFEFTANNINQALITGRYLSTHTNPPISKNSPKEIKKNYVKKLLYHSTLENESDKQSETPINNSITASRCSLSNTNNIPDKTSNLKTENGKINKLNFIKRLLELNKDCETTVRNKISRLAKELDKSWDATHHYYYENQRIIKKIKCMNQQKIDPQKIMAVFKEAIATKTAKKRLNKK